MRVLIVEDSQPTVDLIRLILKECRWEMQDTDSLDEAFKIQKTFEPHIILLDLGLRDSTPEMTLASLPKLCNNALIVLTGNADSDTVGKAFRQGADDCLDKKCLGDRMAFIQTIRNASERFARRHAMSHVDSNTMAAQITMAEKLLINQMPNLQKQMDEFYRKIFTDEDCLSQKMAVVYDKMESMSKDSRIRTTIIIIAMILNTLITVAGMAYNKEVKPIIPMDISH